MEATLQVSRRERFGRNEAVRLRQEGMIPAVLYGGKDGAQALSVDPKALSRILHSEAGVNTLIALKMGETSATRVLVKEYQIDPVSRKFLHVDFFRIAMDKALRVTVQIRLTGEAKGVKAEGGVVDFVHRDIVVECLPADIPEHITIDISELGLHDGVRVKDLQTGGKWKPVSELDMLIVHVVTVKVEAEPEPADAAAAAPGAAPAVPAEPEVIKKGKIEKPDEEKDK
jgi:large subunit ribosomal protein L25